MLEMSELGGNPERSNRIVEPEYNESDTDIEYSLRPAPADTAPLIHDDGTGIQENINQTLLQSLQVHGTRCRRDNQAQTISNPFPLENRGSSS